ncbi:hypothetical protein [Pseudonocardia sp. DLS-67]
MVLSILSALLLLGGGVLAAALFADAQGQEVNEAFLPEAWHDMPADKFFPERLGVVRDVPSWTRQGIDGATECARPALEPQLIEAIEASGCKAVLRATYVDPTATLVATIAVVVLGSGSDAIDVYGAFDPGAEYPGQLVKPYPVPGTPAERWSDDGRGGMAIGPIESLSVDYQPYLAVVAAGYADGRPVEELPEQWDDLSPGTDNERSLDTIADRAMQSYANDLFVTIKELSQ